MFELFLPNASPYFFHIQTAASIGIVLLFVLMRRFMHRFILHFFKRSSHRITELLDDMTSALHKPLDTIWLVIGFYIAFLASPFVVYPHGTQPDLIIGSLELSLAIIPASFLHQTFGTVLIASITWGACNFVGVYEKLLLRMGAIFTLLDNALIIRFTSKIIRLGVIIIGIGLIISQYTNLGTLLTSVGIAGAAFTFIAKDTLINIMSGVVLMIDTPFTIGDWIVVADIEGIVEDVSFRSTRIRTFEQGLVVVPNTTLATDNILNWSTMPKRRYRLALGVSYATSQATLEVFIATISEKLSSLDFIESDSLLVYFDAFDAYALTIVIQCFTPHTDLKGFSNVKHQVNLALMELATVHHIEIAFPTQTVFVNTPEA